MTMFPPSPVPRVVLEIAEPLARLTRAADTSTPPESASLVRAEISALSESARSPPRSTATAPAAPLPKLRVEITASQYQRALEILETWKRRAEEGALLYAERSHLNNVLLTKAVAESLNRCADQLDLYPLNWVYEDDALSGSYAPKDIPFQYFLELRRRNASRHIGDEAFHKLAGTMP